MGSPGCEPKVLLYGLTALAEPLCSAPCGGCTLLPGNSKSPLRQASQSRGIVNSEHRPVMSQLRKLRPTSSHTLQFLHLLHKIHTGLVVKIKLQDTRHGTLKIRTPYTGSY